MIEGRLAHERLIGEFVLLREATLAVAVLGLGFGLLALAWREVRRRSLVVEAFDVPPALEAEGWSGSVVARRLHDQLAFIRDHAVTSAEKRALRQTGIGSDISIPGARVSLNSVFAYLRAMLGRDTFVAGELTGAAEALSVTVRVRDRGRASFAGPAAALDALLLAAGEHIFLETQPYVLAVYRRSRGDDAGAIAALRPLVTGPDARAAALALNLWGEILLQSGDFAGGIARHQAAVQRCPIDQAASAGLMIALASSGQWDAAREVVRAYAARRWRSATAHGLHGQILVYALDIAGAETAGRRCLRRDRRDVSGALSLGFAGVLRHDYAAARRHADRVLDGRRFRFTEQTLPGVMTLLSWTLTCLRDYAAARDYADHMCATRPDHNGGWVRLGHLLLLSGDAAGAIVPLRRATRSGVRSMGATALLARALWQAEGAAAALGYIHEALARNPHDPPLYVVRSDVLAVVGEHKAALEAARHAAASAPSWADGHEAWGRALLAAGDSAGACSRFEQAARLAPRWAAPYLGWGDCLAARGRAADAAAQYARAITCDPLWAAPHAHWGALLERTGDAAGAKAKQVRAASLDPEDPAAPGRHARRRADK